MSLNVASCHHRRIARRAGEPGGCGIVARVTTPAYGRYDVPGYIGALRREGELLAAAAEQAGMAAAVPSCPGWAVRDLLKHTGYVHRWAAGFVSRGLTRPAGGASEEEILGQGPGDAELPGWFREGHAALVRALSEAPPDLDCWAFLPAPSPLAFWARRQAHETAIHRADAERAAASAGPAARGLAGIRTLFEPAFAADGVDELIMGFLARNIRRGSWPGLDGSLAIHADDGAAGSADWLVAAAPAAPGVSRGTGPADCDVTGPAARPLPDAVEPPPAGRAAGDRRPGLLTTFGHALQITW